MAKEKLKQAVKEAGGLRKVSEACGVSYEAARKWLKNGLPRTEWTGETSYSEIICEMQQEYSVDDLLGPRRAA